jgi:hypothetical protein
MLEANTLKPEANCQGFGRKRQRQQTFVSHVVAEGDKEKKIKGDRVAVA